MKRSRLRADPERVREWLRRSRENADLSRSTGLSRGKGLARKVNSSDRPGAPQPKGQKRNRDAEGPLTPRAWRSAVWRLDQARCVSCSAGPFAEDADSWTWQAHHALAKQRLRRERLFMHVWDPRNGVLLCRRCHELQESGLRRVPYEKLPLRVRAFAVELGEWAIDVLERQHPRAVPPGAGRDQEETS